MEKYHEKLCKQMGMTKLKWLNNETKIIYSNKNLMVGFKCGTYSYNSILFETKNLINKEGLIAITNINLPPEIKRKIIQLIEWDNLKSLIIQSFVEREIEDITNIYENFSIFRDDNSQHLNANLNS